MNSEESTDRTYRLEAFAATFLVVEVTADFLIWTILSATSVRENWGEIPAWKIIRHYFVGHFGTFKPLYFHYPEYQVGFPELAHYLPAIVVGLAFARWRGYV